MTTHGNRHLTSYNWLQTDDNRVDHSDECRLPCCHHLG
ncbi:Uncharacterised protein [Vibrio cholerae]|nr:Uncharacterised protein [Vibrio cholerae]CSI45894.1 Uncharacterised protein [Vibrio cholerae]